MFVFVFFYFFLFVDITNWCCCCSCCSATAAADYYCYCCCCCWYCRYVVSSILQMIMFSITEQFLTRSLESKILFFFFDFSNLAFLHTYIMSMARLTLLSPGLWEWLNSLHYIKSRFIDSIHLHAGLVLTLFTKSNVYMCNS